MDPLIIFCYLLTVLLISIFYNVKTKTLFKNKFRPKQDCPDVAIDIERLETQLRVVQKEYQAQENYFRNILSEIPTHVYWKNLDGEYMGCNKFQAIETGLSSVDEIIGLTDFEMPWKEDAHSLQAIDRLVLKIGEPIVAEEVGFLANGKRTTWLSRKAPLRDEDGNIIGIIGTSTDITDQKENEHLEYEKHQEFNKIVRKANHDIASPLVALEVFFGMYAGVIPEEQRISIRSSLNTIRGITSSMLLLNMIRSCCLRYWKYSMKSVLNTKILKSTYMRMWIKMLIFLSSVSMLGLLSV